MSAEPASLARADAVVLAGGRITGLFARVAGTRVKGLIRLGGQPLVTRAAAALRAAPEVGRVIVVGPEAVCAALPGGCDWCPEGDSALANLAAGLAALGEGGEGRVLVCGVDVPALEAAAVSDFLRRAPAEADLCMPVVRREAFRAAFPGEPGIYVQLTEGAFTAGSQLLLNGHVFRRNRPLLERFYALRKSQLAMARAFGWEVVRDLVRGRLSIAELERRASALTGCTCRAVPDCRPGLACDLDTVLDYYSARRRWGP